MIKISLKNKRQKSKKISLILSTVIFTTIFVIGAYAVTVKLNESVEIKSKEISFISSKDISRQVQEKVNETIDSYLKEYSKYYNLDGEKVVSFARSITNDYTIDLNEVGGSIKTDSTEGKCMLFVYYLNKNKLSKPLKDYGFSKEYFKVSNKKTTMGKNQTLSSGLTFSEFLGKVCDIVGVDKNYLLAISYLETGKNTSTLALRNNNFGGLRGNGEYFSYPSPEMGIIAFVLNLKGYEKYNLSSIYELSGIYTHGSVSNPSYTWVNSVKKYYNEIVNNPSKYFLVEDI